MKRTYQVVTKPSTLSSRELGATLPTTRATSSGRPS